METIPATYGFPLPEPGYLEAVKTLCERYDALYIAARLWDTDAEHITAHVLRQGEGLANEDRFAVIIDPYLDRRSGYRFQVSLVGKVATWLLYASLAFTMVTPPGTAWPRWLFWAGLATALAALASYGRKASREVEFSS